jgi:hypothetical protein
MIDKTEKYFTSYFNSLIGLLFTPKSAFIEIFRDRSNYMPKALVFAGMSAILSLGLLLISGHPRVLNINNNWEIFLKDSFVIPLQIVIIVPILSGILHTLAKCFKGHGRIQDSVVIILYSYILAPYATVLLIAFLVVEKILGYPVNLLPPSDPVLRAIEYICQAALLAYGSYILARGTQVAYMVIFRRAALIILSMAVITFLLGFILTLLINKLFFN